jgi:GNAT superfamily N-acetyltransferase
MSGARVAESADAGDVARLLTEFRDWIGAAGPDDASFAASVRRLMDDPATEYLLAGAGPDAVCQVRYRHSVWSGADDCCIEDVFVRESARGQGLGRALVEAALERARARGCRRAELDTHAGNAAALALYRSLGFTSRRPGGEGENLFLRLAL